MKKEELFTDEFLKQFKTGDELNGFLKELHKRGIEKMLKGELDDHLDYEKHKRSSNLNPRNDYSKKKVHASFGESEIAVPGDREDSFNPMIILKRSNMLNDLESIIVSLYAKGMSVSDAFDGSLDPDYSISPLSEKTSFGKIEDYWLLIRNSN